MRSFRSVLVALVLTVTVACASHLPPKEQALSASLRTNQGLALMQDAEANLCWGLPSAMQAKAEVVDLKHCTSPGAAQIGLTDDKHQAFNRALAAAFDAHLKMSAELRLWTVGSPTPSSVGSFIEQLQAALALARTLSPGNAMVGNVVDYALALIKAGQDIAASLKK